MACKRSYITVTLFIDGKPAGEGRVERTEPILFSAGETCDVGFEAGAPVTFDYPKGHTKFSGEVNWVEIDLGKDPEDLGHPISPEERLKSRWPFSKLFMAGSPQGLPVCASRSSVLFEGWLEIAPPRSARPGCTPLPAG